MKETHIRVKSNMKKVSRIPGKSGFRIYPLLEMT